MRTALTLITAFTFAALLSCSSPTEAPPPPKPPDENAAIESLKQINQAQTNFIRRTRRYAQTFDELVADRLLNADATKSVEGYKFLLIPSPDAVSYTLSATPSDPAARHFFTDNSGTIRAESGKPASASSDPL